MSTGSTGLLLAYYGDDFTGSTDALEFLSLAGIKTALFIQPPTPEQLSRYPDLRAIGVAGMTRSMIPDAMEEELRPALTALRNLGPRHIHYKVCSTFDSSPVIGSIGKAIEIGMAVSPASFVPLLVAAPVLGRYCLFGNLFARMGIGSGGAIYRLDRHPSMSRHPTTPSDESDLRLHLARQTNLRIGLMDITQVTLPRQEAKAALDLLVRGGAEIVLFDAVYQEQLAGIGALIDSYALLGQPLFSAGSSGIEMALGAYWQEAGYITPPAAWPAPGVADPLLVVSGSCSPVTAGQIRHAMDKGFADIALDTAAIASSGNPLAISKSVAARVIGLMGEGRSVIVHTSREADDPRIYATSQVLQAQGLSAADIQALTGRLYGTALGLVAREVAAQIPLKRIVVAGGDTSSFAARAMGIDAVEMIAPLSPGAPLCRAHAPGSPIDGLEVNFKGGQVGREDYFDQVRRGVFEP